MNYSIPQPKLSASSWLLAIMVLIGLAGLGIAAYTAFSFIGRPVQALAFALIIEAGMVSESIAIIRRNRVAIPGLVVSLAVSGFYNYTQAAQAGASLPHPITNWLQLAALSIGPLSAVFFLALAVGRELQAHESAIHRWEKERQKWIDDQAEREARRQERRENRREKLAVIPSMALSPTAIDTQPGSYPEFAAVMAGRNGSGPLTAAEIQKRFHISERTAWRWLSRWKEEHATRVGIGL